MLTGNMKFFFFILIFSTTINPQSYIVIDSSTALPVSDAVFKSGSYLGFTSQDGIFTLPLEANNTLVSISHLAFTEKSFIATFKNSLDTIFLLPKTVPVSEVEITGSQNNTISSGSAEFINVSSETGMFYSSIGDLIKQSSSLNVKDYGGLSGIKIVSSRGMGGENTIVLFNEMRVNDMRTGVFDFSSLSLFDVDKIEILKTGDEQYGYISPGGLIKISGDNFAKNDINANLKYSSDGLRSLNIKKNFATTTISGFANFERAYSSNRFDYKFGNSVFERENAYFSKTYFSANLNFLTEKNVTKIFSNYKNMTSGIPGFVVVNNQNSGFAFSENKSFLFSAGNEYCGGDEFSFYNAFSLNYQENNLDDISRDIFLGDLSDFTIFRSFSTVNRVKYKSSQTTAVIGYDFDYSGLSGIKRLLSSQKTPTELDRRLHRIYLSAAFTLIRNSGFSSSISLHPSISFEYEDESTGESKGVTSFNAGIILDSIFNFPVKLTSNYFSAKRQPTFNEKYYSAVFGQSIIKGENYSGFDINFEAKLQFFGLHQFKTSYFNTLGENKIIWVPASIAFQVPRNLKEMTASGIETAYYYYSNRGLINLSFIYNYTKTENLSAVSSNDFSYGKMLLYSPEHIIKGSISTSIEQVTAGISMIGSSESFYTADNDPLYSLKSYVIFDAFASYKFGYKNFDITTGVTVYNIFNTEYLIIQSFPMPLRSWHLSISLTFKD